MDGNILEFKNENIYNKGRMDNLLGLVHDGIINVDVAADRANKKYGIDKKEFRRMLEAYEADGNLMQG